MDIPVLEGNTRDLVDRLARVEGQIHGIARMIEDRRRCDQIVVQLMAARAALEKKDRLHRGTGRLKPNLPTTAQSEICLPFKEAP